MGETLSYFTDNDKQFLKENLFSIFGNKPLVCAEIGNYTGNSTQYFANMLPEGSTFYSVDITRHDIDVPDNVIRVTENSLDWNCPSHLDFVYLDGRHEGHHVFQEIMKFKNHTSIIAGHDLIWISGAIIGIMFDESLKEKFNITLLTNNKSRSWIMIFKSILL